MTPYYEFLVAVLLAVGTITISSIAISLTIFVVYSLYKLIKDDYRDSSTH